MSIKKGEVRDITELAYSTFGNIVDKIGTKDIKSPPKDKMMRADKVNQKRI
jgi:hypothetical protein